MDERLRQHVLETLEVAELQRQDLVSTYVLTFHTAHTVARTTRPNLYPIEIAVDPERFDGTKIYRQPASFAASLKTTCFMLFFVEGHILELEAYSICCDPIDYASACIGARTYSINAEFPMFSLSDQNENSK